MSAALKLDLETEPLSRKLPLGEKRPKLRLVWENPKLSAGTHKEKSKAKLNLVSGQTLYAYVANNPLTRIDPTGLDWVYSQSTGQLTQVTNGQTQQGQGGTGYAGSGQGVNNPAMQNVPNVGPIPQGTYDIGQQRNSPNTGPGILPLTPQPGTNTYGRDNFQIHGDNRQGNQSASEGCMIFNRNTRDQISNSGDNVLRVVP